MGKKLTSKELIAECEKRLAVLRVENRVAYTAVMARLALRAVVYAPPSSFKKNGSQHCIALFRCVAMLHATANAAHAATAIYSIYVNAAGSAAHITNAADASDTAAAAYAASIGGSAAATYVGFAVKKLAVISSALLAALDQDLNITDDGDALLPQPLFNEVPADWHQQATEFFVQLQVSDLEALADYYQQWMGWNNGKPQQTDKKVLRRWVRASGKQWESQTTALRLIAGESTATAASQDAIVKCLEDELAQSQQQSGETVGKKEQLEEELRSAKEEFEILSNEEVKYRTIDADELVNRPLWDIYKKSDDLDRQSKRLLVLGTQGVVIAFAYMLIVGILALCNLLPDLPDFHNYLAIITPGLVSLVAGSLLLRHDNRLRQWDHALLQQKFQVNYGAGLLTTASELSQITDLDKRPIITGAFARILDRYAAGDNPPQQELQEKEQSMLIEKLVNTIVAAKD